MRSWQEVNEMNEVDKILRRQYRRDLMPIWEGISEISEKVMTGQEAAKGFAELLETTGEFDIGKTYGEEAAALWLMGMGICHSVLEIEDLLGIAEDE